MRLANNRLEANPNSDRMTAKRKVRCGRQFSRLHSRVARAAASITGCRANVHTPQPVSAMAETAEAARAAFRKLRREIMFRFFIVVTPFPERAANQKTRSLCGTGLKTKRPCPCVLSTRTGSVNTILRCHLACSASNTAEPLTESQHSPVL